MWASVESRVPDTFEDFLDQELGKELLRLTTAGSVDDGKSTLIGRLLHDCKAVYEDQLASVKRSLVNRSGKEIDFSLLTDGLRAEREQGITIDVAYRYFSTPRRKFIIADTPGHEQYTRNMATGASTADLAIILLDATKGVLAQTRRHAYIASLLGIKHLVAAINKMDLVGYSEEVFARLKQEFGSLAEGLAASFVECIPVSALEGDNIVNRSLKTPWYAGPTLLEHLEEVPLRTPAPSDALRFPVQLVIRPDASFRGFAGRIASGTIRKGDGVLALPSSRKTSIESIATFGGESEFAVSGESVVLTLADEIDLSRGDMLVSPETAPQVSGRFAAMVVWLHREELRLNRTYLVKHAGRYVKAHIRSIRFCVDINALTEYGADVLGMNEIGLVEIETVQPLFLDAYALNRSTGSLILIDPLTNATVGAAMVRETLSSLGTGYGLATDIVEARAQRRGHHGGIFSLQWERQHAEALEQQLHDHGFEAVLVNHGEIASQARRIFYETLLGLGIVVLAWNERPFRRKDNALFQELAGEFYSELSDRSGVADESSALKAAERLRLPGAPSGRGEDN
jgi:bifunctional enzyme CysN/CysC/sulfate adenylyltransferase subunit 1